jgi:hypothetical protein
LARLILKLFVRIRSLALALLLAALGCSSPLSTTAVGDNGGGSRQSSSAAHHGATGSSSSGGPVADGGSSAASSSASGVATPSSTGSATSSASSSASSSSAAGGCTAVYGTNGNGLFQCTGPPAIDGGPPGCTGPYFASTVQDMSSCGAICDATVTLLDENGAPIPGASEISNAQTGAVDLCLPSHYVFTPSAAAPGYPLFYYAEVDGELTQAFAGMGMLSDNSVSSFGAVLPDYSASTGTLVVFVYTNGQCTNVSGWSVSISLPDGGPWPDGGYLRFYCDGTTGYPDPNLTATSGYGVAGFTGLDPTLSQLVLVSFTNADAGACGALNASAGFTGRIRIGVGDISIDPLLVP